MHNFAISNIEYVKCMFIHDIFITSESVQINIGSAQQVSIELRIRVVLVLRSLVFYQ